MKMKSRKRRRTSSFKYIHTVPIQLGLVEDMDRERDRMKTQKIYPHALHITLQITSHERGRE
jgi:hypothetical protein